MSQRSPYHERYKTGSKGTTRKSASAAKPKRKAADITPAGGKKAASPAPKTAWGRSRAAAASRSRAAQASQPAFTPTPRMKMLRRYWWIAWGLSLVIALGILLMQQLKYTTFIGPAWIAWAATMAAAFYLEFGPLRKERAEAIEAAKAAKSSKSSKRGKGDEAVPPSTGDDAE